MKKVTTSKIVRIAKKLQKEGKPWHFHILSPGCFFNKNKKFALILENSETKEEFIHLTLRRPSKTGQKLVEMLHGRGISKSKKKKTGNLSIKVRKMVERAKELNNKGFSWHHHLLFPDCVFNKDKRYWTLVFEDPINDDVIEEKFKDEPKTALSQIEPLYYSK